MNLDPFQRTSASYPAHWGGPPMRQTRDWRPLPLPFGGMGSGTLAKWIAKKQAEDAAASNDGSSVGVPSGTRPSYPAHWGEPPMRQTRDLRPLPLPFGGMGSGTLAKWIAKKQAEDAAASNDGSSVGVPSGTRPSYPAHWGEPPMRQTRDLRPLPLPFGGMGSGTLAKWIAKKQAEDAAASSDSSSLGEEKKEKQHFNNSVELNIRTKIGKLEERLLVAQRNRNWKRCEKLDNKIIRLRKRLESLCRKRQ
eukprot:g3096.t1